MFLLFAGDTYYPAGGWKDYKGSFTSEDDARVAAQGFDWFQIVSGGEIIAGSYW